MVGDVSIVQLSGFPSGSSIVRLSDVMVIGTPLDKLVGVMAEKAGGLLYGGASVVKVNVLFVHVSPSDALTYHV
jgi:hypothetical protein